jgi:hypothetical protein
MNFPARMGSCLLLIGLLAFPAEVFSCSCAPPREDVETDIKVSVGRADVVFLGKAEKVVRIATSKEIIKKEGYDPEIDETTFEVLKSWKGVSSDRIVTRISIVCCLCGYHFEAGKTYLVYATMGDDGAISTSICHRTQPLTSEQISESIDIKVLNRFWGR